MLVMRAPALVNDKEKGLAVASPFSFFQRHACCLGRKVALFVVIRDVAGRWERFAFVRAWGAAASDDLVAHFVFDLDAARVADRAVGIVGVADADVQFGGAPLSVATVTVFEADATLLFERNTLVEAFV